MEKQATRDAYGRELARLGGKYEDIVVLDADLSKSTKTCDFARAFPARFFDAGIAEQNMTGMAAGLAVSGKTVYISSFAVFATGRNWEQIRNSLAYPRLNVKVCATHAGITVGEDGGSHQAVEDIALMRAIPGMTVIVPADGVSAARAVEALYHHPGPAYLRLGRSAVPVLYGEDMEFHIGKGAALRSGSDVAIIACGLAVSEALGAADILSQQGIEAAVIDMYSLKPLDVELVLKMARQCGRIVTVEEHNVIGGLGSAVCEAVAAGCPVPVKRLGIEDRFGQSGKPDELMKEYGIDAESIARQVAAFIKA
ncbi:MAG: transketolase family protein [Syntrophomonadaceae bacterium]|nr:transketolase family protein [Syntrophomonadaceae bacterium]